MQKGIEVPEFPPWGKANSNTAMLGFWIWQETSSCGKPPPLYPSRLFLFCSDRSLILRGNGL